MGLQDLLAVVLGVKTAEYLEQRRDARAARAETIGMIFGDTYDHLADTVVDEFQGAAALGEPYLREWAGRARPRVAGFRETFLMLEQRSPDMDPRMRGLLSDLDRFIVAWDWMAWALEAGRPDWQGYLEVCGLQWRDIVNQVYYLHSQVTGRPGSRR